MKDIELLKKFVAIGIEIGAIDFNKINSVMKIAGSSKRLALWNGGVLFKDNYPDGN